MKLNVYSFTIDLLRLFALIFTLLVTPMAYSKDIDSLIQKYSLIEKLDPNLVRSIIYRESRFNPNVKSNKGAIGLMQVLPSTASFLGVSGNLYDPEINIKAGTRYLGYLSNLFNRNLVKIIAAYNAGHGAVIKYDGVPRYRETRNYVIAVADRYIALSNSPSLDSSPKQEHNYYRASNSKPMNVSYQQASFNADTTIYVNKNLYSNVKESVNNEPTTDTF
ncbi:lytic transglycosylase domain-containing protein (plasmid) [Acinetobacter sp. ESL0695]|uniref:lytic transglycosylase domain-containing protein n=1 Tax=Acinetobacter sp. ESL0695 TaxID=2983215 RepID=UPI0023F1C6E3|nr:lytic transglycosylase domain-containing protein [Acinetobacter sp. ESL0695]WEV50225.1 lytic transglycosylase domain-containing protein [Acinetobacter sp. ESL0695]